MQRETIRVIGKRRKKHLNVETRECLASGGAHRSDMEYDRNKAKRDLRRQGW